MLLKKLMKIKNQKKNNLYLMKKKILPEKRVCHKCKSKMLLDLDIKVFRCQKKNHEVVSSILKNTFFSSFKIGINNLLLLCYLYSYKTPNSGIVNMIGIQSQAVT